MQQQLNGGFPVKYCWMLWTDQTLCMSVSRSQSHSFMMAPLLPDMPPHLSLRSWSLNCGLHSGLHRQLLYVGLDYDSFEFGSQILFVAAISCHNKKICVVVTVSFLNAGHTNEKNFVGLSVSQDGYIACGSENNAVYCYHKAVPTPICDHKFGMSGQQDDPTEAHQFVSSVCWSRKSNTMISANSMGNIKVLELV